MDVVKRKDVEVLVCDKLGWKPERAVRSSIYEMINSLEKRGIKFKELINNESHNLPINNAEVPNSNGNGFGTMKVSYEKSDEDFKFSEEGGTKIRSESRDNSSKLSRYSPLQLSPAPPTPSTRAPKSIKMAKPTTPRDSVPVADTDKVWSQSSGTHSPTVMRSREESDQTHFQELDQLQSQTHRQTLTHISVDHCREDQSEYESESDIDNNYTRRTYGQTPKNLDEFESVKFPADATSQSKNEDDRNKEGGVKEIKANRESDWQPRYSRSCSHAVHEKDNRLALLDTLEDIKLCVDSTYAKFKKIIVLQNEIALNPHFDTNDVKDMEDCLQRYKASLLEDQQNLKDRLLTFKTALENRKSLEKKALEAADDQFKRKWVEKNEEIRKRLDVIEKAAVYDYFATERVKKTETETQTETNKIWDKPMVK